MAQSKLELILEMRDRLTSSLKRAKDAVSQSSEEMKQKMRSLKTSFIGAVSEMRQELPLLDKALRLMSNPIVLLTTAIGAVGAGVSRLKQFASESIETYRVQAEAETKLAQVMRNTMGARSAEVNSIKQLASEQQRLGVIGDEVQLAGAQELGTYLTKAKNLRTLLPVMNDMVAQQYGYNATQESAVNIATMMGKVMDGQVGALSRYGYKFTEAQEAILKFGTEEQRAATLAAVVSESVGGVNAALASTPEGRLKQYENNLGDLHERAGAFFNYLKAAWLPVGEALMDGWQRVMRVFERNREEIMQMVQSIATFVGNVIRSVFTMAGYLKNAISFIYEWRAAIYGVITAYTLLHAQQIVAIAKLTLQTIGTKLLTAAQWLLNIAMSANPIGLIIVAIGALIGAIVAVCQKFEGWSTLWEAIKATLSASIGQYVATVKFLFQDLWANLRIGWEYIKAFASFVSNIASMVWNAIKSRIQPLIDLFDTVKQSVMSLWSNVSTAGQQMGQTVVQTSETIKSTIGSIVESVRGFFLRLWQNVVNIWQRVVGFVARIGGLLTQVTQVVRSKFEDIVAPVVAVFDKISAKFQSFVDKIKGLVKRVGELLSNTGEAIKQFLSGKWDEAKQLFKQGLDTDAVVTLRTERDLNRQNYQNESLDRARDAVSAWRNVDIHRKTTDSAETDSQASTETDYNTSSALGGGDSSASQTIAGSAKQIRNITVNIEAFNKGGINTTNTEGLHGLSATDIEDWFNQMLLRTIRNIEMSY